MLQPEGFANASAKMDYATGGFTKVLTIGLDSYSSTVLSHITHTHCPVEYTSIFPLPSIVVSYPIKEIIAF